MSHVTNMLPSAVVILIEEGEKSENCEKRHKSSHQVERACAPQYLYMINFIDLFIFKLSDKISSTLDFVVYQNEHFHILN